MPDTPVSPRRAQVLSFGLLGGLIVALAIGIGRDLLDPSVKTAADVRRFGNLEVLAVLPDRSRKAG